LFCELKIDDYSSEYVKKLLILILLYYIYCFYGIVELMIIASNGGV